MKLGVREVRLLIPYILVCFGFVEWLIFKQMGRFGFAKVKAIPWFKKVRLVYLDMRQYAKRHTLPSSS